MSAPERSTALNAFLPSLFRLGTIYGAYRLTLATFLLLLHWLTRAQPIVGGDSPKLYFYAVFLYTLGSLGQLTLYLRWRHWIDEQLLLMLAADVLALSVMLYANGGPNLQMSMLYLVLVVAATILLSAGRALFIAILSVLAVVWQQFYFALTEQSDIRTVGAALLLSSSFIGVYLLTRDLVSRLRVMEKMAFEQGQQMRQLQAINQRIVEQLKAGVVVVDEAQQVILSNLAARQLLQSPIGRDSVLSRVSPELSRLLSERNSAQSYFILPASSQGQRQALGVHVLPLHNPLQHSLQLLLLENLDGVNQQAQQLKLASLGRLTASIAHEIRNPLAAIRQAAELLHEDAEQQHTDVLLMNMIIQQSDRINRIINSILQLSRKQATPEWIGLEEFLHTLTREQFAGRPIRLTVTADLQVFFDRDQLQQVLINLISNALHHGGKNTADPDVLVVAYQDGPDQPVVVDVIDHGPGLSAQAQVNLFEPFVTTENSGTGLGLYLSRAYCEANGARLFNVPTPRGACFRVSFQAQTAAPAEINMA